MCQPPKPPTKACGACGLEKDASCYSKKQFAAKATRRCRDCLAKNADVKEEVAISRAPGPLAKTICWDLYYLLLGAGKDDASPQAKKEAYLRATQGLTEPEIRQDDFSDREAACMAALRGMALLDTPCGADGRPAALVLVSRATLWLARAALRARPLEFDLVAYNKMFEDGGQPLHIVLKCYTVALRKFPQAASLCLALYAHACIRAVAAERGSPEVVRPAWGEAWLVRAEVEVFLGELHAAAHAKSATGRRPLGRLGPDKDDKAATFLDDDALLEQTSQWEVSVPGYAPQRVGAPGSKAPSTHLATYWWGLEEKVAKVILAKSIGQALGCLERCHGACKADERKRLETRHRDCEVQAFRRGAAALCACSAGIDAGDEHKHRYLDGFRKLVPGEPHSADDAFVNSLEREQGKVSLWAVASVDGAACVVDVGDSSAYAGAVLAKASVDLSDASVMRQTLVEAMAGASDEARCMAGPPRRPRSIEFHSDLETIAEALRDDLKTAFDVDVVVGKKDAPKRNAFKACRSGDAPPFAAGDAVRVGGLVSKPQHNGRAGAVARWLPAKKRFEVTLEATDELPETSLALKAEHLSIVG